MPTRKTKYARRKHDREYMAWIPQQPCSIPHCRTRQKIEVAHVDEPAPDQILYDQARFRNHPFRCVYCGSEYHGTDGCAANDEERD